MSGSNFKFCPMCATPLEEKYTFDSLRSVCPACGFIHFLDPKVVVVVVVEHQGRILLGRRNINPGMGMWNIPGGYVNRGEKVEEAAIREIKEETNLDIELDGLVGVYSEKDQPHVIVVYSARVLKDDISAIEGQPEEVTELEFFAPSAMPEMAFGSEAQILIDWSKQHEQEKR